jgi:hypothetical protein
MTKLTSEQEKHLENLKRLHDYYVVAVQHYTQKMTFLFDEFDFVKEQVAYFRHQIKAILAEIHKIEPPKEEEKKAPLVMDLTHIKPEEKPKLEVVK